MKIELSDVSEVLNRLDAGPNRMAGTMAAFKQANGDVELAVELSWEKFGFADAVVDVAVTCAKAGKTKGGSAILESKVILPSGRVYAKKK